MCDKQVTEISLTILSYQPCYVNHLLETTRALMSAKWQQSACPSALRTLEVTSCSAPYFQSRLHVRVLSRMENTAVEVRRAAFAVWAQVRLLILRYSVIYNITPMQEAEMKCELLQQRLITCRSKTMTQIHRYFCSVTAANVGVTTRFKSHTNIPTRLISTVCNEIGQVWSLCYRFRNCFPKLTNADFPTPPEPRTTSLYSRMVWSVQIETIWKAGKKPTVKSVHVHANSRRCLLKVATRSPSPNTPEDKNLLNNG